jgi:hypothetical protein
MDIDRLKQLSGINEGTDTDELVNIVKTFFKKYRRTSSMYTDDLIEAFHAEFDDYIKRNSGRP